MMSKSGSILFKKSMEVEGAVETASLAKATEENNPDNIIERPIINNYQTIEVYNCSLLCKSNTS